VAKDRMCRKQAMVEIPVDIDNFCKKKEWKEA
jgi:hypothetical protein